MSDVETPEVAVLPGMEPPPRIETPYEAALDGVKVALTITRERLIALRKQREEINGEIKMLVAEEALLQRMAKVQEK